MIQELFTEKFRPKTLEQMILPERIRKSIGNGELQQNYLFYGSPGLGKTSLAKVLASNYPYLYINVSDESSVDVIREKITNWCSTISLLDGAEKYKVVILDEMDGASDQFYKALRATIEKFAATARFVGTCNYINKVPDPVQSRFTCISFDFLNKEEEKEVMVEFIKRTWSILKQADIEIEKEAVIEFVKRNFPDMRSILNKTQNFIIQGVKQIRVEDIKQLNYSFRDIFELICAPKPDPTETYKFMMSNYGSKVDEVLASLGSELPEYIKENQPKLVGKIPQVVIKAAHYQSQRVTVIDPAISMVAAIYECQMIMNS
jgi:replication-associated recombination protein RarA